MGWSRDLGFCDAEEIAGIAKVMCRDLGESEPRTLAAAITTAKAGVVALGGRAHVWIGGHDRPHHAGSNAADDPVEVAQTSITVILSLREEP